MHERRRKKFFTLPVLKSETKIWIFFTLTNYKSKVQVSDSSINYFGWVQKKCNKQLCTKLNCDWAKAIFNLQINFSLAKKEIARPPTHTIAPLKRWVKVLDPLLLSSWPVTFVELNRELFLKQSCQSIVKKCLKERPSTCENVMLLRK